MSLPWAGRVNEFVQSDAQTVKPFETASRAGFAGRADGLPLPRADYLGLNSRCQTQ
jgi:hypothetical protein